MIVCLNILIKIIFILISVAYFTIAERKVMAAVQRRHGPDVVGILGLLQPLADGFKLVVKELLIPTKTEQNGFLLAPIVILTLSLISWSIIPFGFQSNKTAIITNYATYHGGIQTSYDYSHIANPIVKFFHNFFHSMWAPYKSYNAVWVLDLFTSYSVANIACGVLFLLAISSFNVYGIIIAGWSSNSKYAFLGALRSAAQMISYEVAIGLILLPIIMLSQSLNLTDIVMTQAKSSAFLFPLMPCSIAFFISMLAETNRAPFDLPEAEAELVAGYNVEYSSIIFAMFFLGEYSNMILMSVLCVLFFFSGWAHGIMFFVLKIVFFCFLFILTRAAFPRYRYDQLMNIGWKVFLPVLSGYLIVSIAVYII